MRSKAQDTRDKEIRKLWKEFYEETPQIGKGTIYGLLAAKYYLSVYQIANIVHNRKYKKKEPVPTEDLEGRA